MNAQDLTKALDGRWHGSYGTARCPAHDDHDPSLSVSEGQDGKLLVKCHMQVDPALSTPLHAGVGRPDAGVGEMLARRDTP